MGKHIVIIGNGIAGITAARHIRKRADYKITIISKETKYFYSRTALMYIYMGHMKFKDTQPYEPEFWLKNRLDLVQDEVLIINGSAKSLSLKKGGELSYDALILATGSSSNKFGWPGQDLDAVQGLFSYQDLQSMEKYSVDTKCAVIVGGGLIGVEMAEMFLSRNIAVTFLVREKAFWDIVLPAEEATMIGDHIIKDHHIDLRFETELKEILPDKNRRVRAIITSKEDELPCEFVGLTVGVHPNIAFVRESDVNCDRGILINEYFETNVEGIYAIGDCAQFREPLPNRRPIEQVWYTGRMHGETLASTITGNRQEYRPGIWWNSAKFFDIEYQTYGVVFPNPPEGQETFVWQDFEKRRLVRINYDKQTKAVEAFNFFGVRARHNVCEEWIRKKVSVETVLENLAAANFDPEFYQQNEAQIITHYNKLNNTSLQSKVKKGLFTKYIKNLFSPA